MLKSLGRHPFVLRAAGNLLAGYFLLVRRTSTAAIEPADFYERIRDDLPVIVTMWHGQHFMLPFARPSGWETHVMISRSADGEINAIAAAKLGMGLIRASGAHSKHQTQKRGGMRGFIECLRILRSGGSVSLTADVPKGPARVAGMGIVQLARHSGCPILPMGVATSRNIDLDSWDKASISLPFSHTGIVGGDLIRVAPDADDAALEDARKAVEAGLDAVTRRAYELAEDKRVRMPWPDENVGGDVSTREAAGRPPEGVSSARGGHD